MKKIRPMNEFEPALEKARVFKTYILNSPNLSGPLFGNFYLEEYLFYLFFLR